MKTRNFKLVLLIGAVIFTQSSCNLLKPVERTSAISTPSTFADQNDSVGIGSQSWKVFFTDKKLVALIDTALQNNLDLKMAIQRIEMAKTNIMLSKGAMLPVVTGDVSGGGRKFGDYTMDGVGNYDTNFSDNLDPDRKLPAPFMPDYYVGFRSAWEVDIWGKLKSRKKAAYERFLATEKARLAIMTSLVSQVASMYYDLVYLDTELDIIRKNVRLQESAVSTITIQKEGGRANELGVRQFTAQLLNTRGLEVEILQRIIETENSLNTLIGRFPQHITRSTSIEQILPGQLSAGIPAEMLRRRPDIQQAQLELAANYSDQQAAQLALLPSLNITALLGFNAFSTSLLFSPGSLAYGAMGGLTAPLVNRKGLKADQKRTQAASMEALFAYNKAVLTGFQEVSSSLKRINNNQRIGDFKKNEVEVLQQAVAASQDLFLGGAATYLEIIMAQKSVLEAELALANIQKQQFLASIDLYHSLGGGWE